MRVCSLFSGIGGFDLAFKELDFEIVFANEMDKFACQTYRANFPNHNLVEGDIRKIDAKDIPPHDVLTAGFPCQPFSIAQSNKKGLEHSSGDLFWEIIRVLKYHKPSCFLLENVKGLTFKNNKEIFSTILKELEDCDYQVQWKVLNAKDFGVPQNRERIFIIGFRDKNINFVFPIPNKKVGLKLSDILEKEVDEKYYLSDKAWSGLLNRKEKLGEKGNGRVFSLFNKNSSHVATIPARYYKDGKDVLISENIDKKERITHDHVLDQKDILSSTNTKKNTWPLKSKTESEKNQVSIFQYRRNYIRENKENISPTLTSNMGTGGNNVPMIFYPKHNNENNKVEQIGNINGKNLQGNRVYDENGLAVSLSANSGGIASNTGAYLVNNRVRKLTPRECARLMSFPNSFKIVCSDSQSYKQFGNSVVVSLIQQIAENIKKSILSKKL